MLSKIKASSSKPSTNKTLTNKKLTNKDLPDKKTYDDDKSDLIRKGAIKVKKNKQEELIPEIIIHITRSGTYIHNTKELSHLIIRKIQNYYTLHDKTILGYISSTSLWYYRNNLLYLPRFGSLLLENKFKNIKFINYINPQNPLPNLKYKGEFKGNQEIVFNGIISKYFSNEMIEKGRGGLVLNLQAGHGKSFVSMALINYLKCRTLVVTHNTTKLNEWVSILEEYVSNVKIGQYYGKKKIHGDIIVAVINSIVMDDIKLNNYNSFREFFDSFDLIIFDECHEYVSKTKRQVYNICQVPYMIGLSATPDERIVDSLDKVSRWCCGPILVSDKIKGYTLDDIPFKGIVRCIKYSASDEYSEHIVNEKLDMVSVPATISQICEDPQRIKLIIKLISELYKKNMNILVFADRRSYLETIKNALNTEIKNNLGSDLDKDKTISDNPSDNPSNN